MINEMIVVFVLVIILLTVGVIPYMEKTWYTPLGEIKIDGEIYCQWESWTEHITIIEYIYWEYYNGK